MRKTATLPKSGRMVDFLGVSPYKPGHVREAGPAKAAAAAPCDIQKNAHQEGPHSAVIK
jgi:hypothetical protein